MTREEQLLNGFTDMMKGFWKNQDLEVPHLGTLKSNDNQQPCHEQLVGWLKELKQLREQTRWIPINERPPEKDVDVLVTDDAGGLATVHIDSYGEREGSGEGFWYISQNVTAWKYFPQPYKAESEE